MPWLTLFAATATLICCALPLVLVTLGFGASVAALTNSVPFLISLSEASLRRRSITRLLRSELDRSAEP
jgi:hypothetical protein